MDLNSYGFNEVDRFREDLFKELGIENNPKRDELFGIAWEMGHSSGFSEVYYIATDLVRLIK